jgi:hypothetical protein
VYSEISVTSVYLHGSCCCSLRECPDKALAITIVVPFLLLVWRSQSSPFPIRAWFPVLLDIDNGALDHSSPWDLGHRSDTRPATHPREGTDSNSPSFDTRGR